ncbi:MAG: DUF255 domain-containing protein [Bacteroidota bacterium]|nr:DUF255 domain-containing protein [Bacteroidota bacterium]
MSTSESNKFTNRLIHSNSLYLKQHAHNPVNWYPWGEEALVAAQESDKLLLISIGYSACHWCHVMAHECFEDEVTAKYMSDHFICVKVDREEHPQVDQLYMDACQMMTKRGGWPLNAFALPNGRPIYAGTYFPKPNWTGLMRELSHGYKTKKEQYLDYADKVMLGIEQNSLTPSIDNELTFSSGQILEFLPSLSQNFDLETGGRMPAPKFPMPDNWQYLIQLYINDYTTVPDNEHLLLTLQTMANRGLFDQIEGGFYRYSTDAEYIVPHFEKMLYDNGQLLNLYSRASILYPENKLFKHIADSTCQFLYDQLFDENEGLFHSSLDADSEGVEGKYYTYSLQEYEAALGNDLAKIYGSLIGDGLGYWAEEKLYNPLRLQYDVNDNDIYNKLKQFRKQHKPYPSRDEKKVLSWNCLTALGLLTYCELNQKFKSKLTTLVNTIITTYLSNENNLIRVAGNNNLSACLDDYALLIKLLVEYSGKYSEPKLMTLAFDLCQKCIDFFETDEKVYLYYSSTIDKSQIISRKIELQDNVIAAGNSIMAQNLYTLGILFDKNEWTLRAENMLKGIIPLLNTSLPWFSNWGILHQHLSLNYQMLIGIGEEIELTKQLSSIDSRLLLKYQVLLSTESNSIPFFDGKITGSWYVCNANTCTAYGTKLSEVLI